MYTGICFSADGILSSLFPSISIITCESFHPLICPLFYSVIIRIVVVHCWSSPLPPIRTCQQLRPDIYADNINHYDHHYNTRDEGWRHSRTKWTNSIKRIGESCPIHDCHHTTCTKPGAFIYGNGRGGWFSILLVLASWFTFLWMAASGVATIHLQVCRQSGICWIHNSFATRG